MAERENAQMHAPTWKWEWNPNTITMICGFAAGLIAWGYTLSELQTGRDTNAGNIARLEQRLTALEVTARVLENHELRIARVETQATDAATAMRSVEAALNQLSSDTRLMRELLERLERGQNGNRPP